MSQQNERLAVAVKNRCNKIEIIGEMHVYKLPLKSAPSISGVPSIVRRFSFGEPNQRMITEKKTILLMGATGSGKTTMINAMINFILGVEWEDDFRFMLVEEEIRGASQANSQTQGVTAYEIHYQNGFRIPFSLTIVDTPGFGDTGGTGRDKEITSAIQQLFEHQNGIQELNAVGFVVQSALVRLTNSQKDIFSSVLSIFGKDIGKNVRFLVTFADGCEPPVLAAIKKAKLTCLVDSTGSPCYQSFNNGAVYKSQKSANAKRLHLDWEDVLANFESFFDDISRMSTTSLQMSKEVLQDRKELESKLKWMQSAVSTHLSKMAELRTKEAAVKLQKERINANQDFEIKIQVSKKVKVPQNYLGALNCNKCETTCHHPCHPGIAFRWCPAFYAASAPPLLSTVAMLVNTVTNNNCQVCTGRCHPNDHVHEKHRWVYKDVEEKQTIYNMRKTYDDAIGEKLTAEQLVKEIKQELEQLKDKVIKAMDCITYLRNHLEENALRNHLEENALSKNPLSTTEYIQELIDTEINQHDEGFGDRIKSLKQLLDLAKLTRDIVDNEENFASQFKLFD